jgi:LmbE family N-acetylglucosaminyl deacetylase
LLCSAARLGLAAAGPAPLRAARQTSDPSKRKLKAIFAGGHPGDQEYGCGGTIARYSDLGHEVVLLYLNRGDWGFLEKPPESPLADRVVEARNACKILNARAAFASQRNGKAVVDHAHAAEFGKLFEAENPDVIFTQWPVDNHADHRAIFALAYEAWRSIKKKPALYFYEVSNGEDTLMFAPTHYVDVTSTEGRKRQACYAHASQSPDRYYDMQMRTMAFRGLESGYKYAEAYIRHVQSPDGFLP